MSVLIWPPMEGQPWPTLGPQVVQRIEDTLVFGPGDLRGEPARVDDEKRALIYRAYEVYPKDHPQAGRRRFKRVVWSLRKGLAKTELAAWLAAIELDPEGPVRCDGWRKVGRVWEPVGRPVRDPYIPMLAYTEEQTDDLAYAALMVVIGEGSNADAYDIGLQRIMRKNGDGKAVALAGSPNARDGARTTFQHFDEPHRYITERLRSAHRTMEANLPKRKLADAWSLATTTSFAPGENSVAETLMDEARAAKAAGDKDSRLFYFHRQAPDDADLSTRAGLMSAIVEASGPVAAGWSDLEAIADQWSSAASPADRVYLGRVWLNQIIQGAAKAFDAERWKELAVKRDHVVPDKALITLGFDGSRIWDATALIATEVASGYQWPIGIWQRPLNVEQWEVPAEDVDAAVRAAFARYDVWRMYADPPYWESTISAWAGTYGKERVAEWWTNRPKSMAYALRSYAGAISRGDISHCPVSERLCSGFTDHLGNATRKDTGYKDDGGVLWIVEKDRPGSPNKIDAVVAAALSWEARNDAIAAGALNVVPTVKPRFFPIEPVPAWAD